MVNITRRIAAAVTVTMSPYLCFRVFCVLTVPVCAGSSRVCPAGCVCAGPSMGCDLEGTGGRMPHMLPTGIASVRLINWGCSVLAWKGLRKLQLMDTIYVCNRPILQLPDLEVLKINTYDLYRRLNVLDRQSAMGVKELFFIGNKRLMFENIANLIEGEKFDKLERLVIDGICSNNDDPLLPAPHAFFEGLTEKLELRRLELINLEITELDFLSSKCPPRLHLISFKGSGIDRIKTYYDSTQRHVCQSLRVLDLSQTKVRSVQMLISSLSYFLSMSSHTLGSFIPKLHLFDYCLNVETILLRGFIKSPIEARRGLTFDMSDVRSPRIYKSIDASYNQVTFFNGSLIASNKSGFEHFNLSFNTLQFLSPGFLKPGWVVKSLDLSSNRLFVMEAEYPRDFALLLHSYPYLEYIYLAYNRLTDIPWNMFSQNQRLVHIDLGNNNLVSISKLHFTACVNLAYIGLDGNMLVFQDFSDIKPLKSLITIQEQECTINNSLASVGKQTGLVNESGESKVELKVNLTGTKFKCTCDNLDFQKWTLNNVDVFKSETNTSVFCKFEGEQYAIQTNKIEEIFKICDLRHKTIEILIWTGSVLCSIGILIIIGCCIRRHMVAKNQIRELIKKLRGNEFPLEYLVFLSHCSADDELVINYIMPSLSKAMKDATMSNRDFVCLADKHFRPGHNIIEEVMRCIEKSAVVILIISNTYIKSPWCDMEAKEAASQQKPLIMVLTETVGETEMSIVLRQLFNRFARFKCITNGDGQQEVVPTWETLTNSVLELAVEQMNK